MGYLDYLKHGKKMFRKKGELPVYLVYFITDACNAKCKHCLLADGAHPGWEEPSMTYRKQELSLEEIDKVSTSMMPSVLKEWSSLKLRKAWRKVTGKQPARATLATCGTGASTTATA